MMDSSFWILCHESGVHPHLWVLWQLPVLVPQTVYNQIMVPTHYRDQPDFQQAYRSGFLVVHDPNIPPNNPFGQGEREVLTLAEEMQAVALIDDHQPYLFGIQQGLMAINVPEFIISLMWTGYITVAEAASAFQKLQSSSRVHTNKKVLTWAIGQVRRRQQMQGGPP
ncbi:MAG: hypothetical protein K6U87_10200 [Firmicutes bacterium]|nr:hypothetical protein [Bacillota bacterium]